MNEQQFRTEQIKDDIVLWIRKYFEQNGRNCNAVVGISGGKDSSVVAALCVEALGKDRVIGIKMPCGKQNDIDYANNVIDFLGIQSFEANIEPVFDAMKNIVYKASNSAISNAAAVSLKPRLRMCVLYAFAQTFNGRVANTGNRSESAVGYYTRFGDGAGDFAPIANLTVTQVIAIGKECGLPDKLIEKAPSDGLCGKTDEEALGFLYKELDNFLEYGTSGNNDKDILILSKMKQNEWKKHGIFEFALSKNA